MTIKPTGVVDICQCCRLGADIWVTRYGVDMRRWCLDCWKALATRKAAGA